MKKIFFLSLSLTLLLSCSSSLPVIETIDWNTEKKTVDNIEYKCNIQIIDNAMPTMSSEPRKYLYAIVSLSTELEKLRNNWKISCFEFGGKTYNHFDDNSFSGKDEPFYRNAVREIDKVNRSGPKAEIHFINDKGEELKFEFASLRIRVVY